MEEIGTLLADVSSADRTGSKRKAFALFTIVERSDRSFWRRIGTAFVNRDGSFNLVFDALPVNGTAHLREVEYEARRQEGVPTAREAREGAGQS